MLSFQMILKDPRFTQAGLGIASGLAIFILLILLRRSIRDRTSGAHGGVRRYIHVISASTSLSAALVFCAAIGLAAASVSRSLNRTAHYALVFAVLIQVGLWLDAVFGEKLKATMRARRESDPSSVSAFWLIGFAVRIALWSVIAIAALDNVGFNVTTLIAGLGVGSIAIALAVQNILGDIFSSVSIILDKPFEVGDLISVDQYSGVVEKIGIKSTRIRSVQGEQIIMPNANLLSSRILNFKRMRERRAVISFSVSYDTPTDKLRAVSAIAEKALEGRHDVRFERAGLRGFGDSAIQFELVFFFLSSDLRAYTKIQEQIAFDLLEALRTEKIEFSLRPPVAAPEVGRPKAA